MGLIKEPLDVDFTVDPRILTKEEKSAISEYIRTYKGEVEKISAPTVSNKRGISKRTAVKY